jgi:protocatechuate 3,4-dioxygenase, beta subunit
MDENNILNLRGTLLPRIAHPQRRALIGSAAGLLLAPQLAWADTRITTLVLTPEQSEGPFYPQGSFFAARSELDADLLNVAGSPTTARGTPLLLNGRVLQANGAALANATVEIWQCDSNGQYAYDIATLHKTDKGFQGFGRAVTDARGHYAFRTLKPVAYYGRPPHIHMKVWQGTGATRKALLTTQMYVRGEVYADDGVFRAARDTAARERLIASVRPQGNDLVAQWDVVVAV